MDDIKNKIEDWFSEVIQSCLLWSQANKKWTAATVILLVVSFGVGSYVAWPALMGVLAAQREFLGALFASQRSISLTDNTAGAAAPAAKDCPFETSEAPTHEKVIFNEIAWMGNKESANNEWIELKNISSDVIDIAGWNLVNKNEKIRVIFHTSAKIPVGGFDLLERDGKAEDFFTGSLKNNGDSFRLFDRDCNLIDQILGATGWPAGDNKTKKTMERSSATLTWHTSSVAGGTPKKENSVSAPKPQSAVLQIIPTAKGHLFISEIMTTFVEFYNSGPGVIDLTGWTIKKKTSTGSESVFITTSRLKSKTVQPGKYFLAASATGYAGSVLPDVTWPSSYALSSTNNAIAVYDNLGKKIEEVGWTLIPKGQSYQRDSWLSGTFHVGVAPNPQNSHE